MSLRTRLILAFFAVSVVPLTIVTLYSYRSSEAALRKAAEEEGRRAAAEMGQRMETVTAALSEQLDLLWDLPRAPRAPARPSESDPRTAAALAQALGKTASLLERLEFVPEPPRPPGAPAAPKAPMPTAPAAAEIERARRASAVEREASNVEHDASTVEREAASAEREAAERIVVDIAGAIEHASRAIGEARGKPGEPASPWVALVTHGLAQGLKVGAAAGAAGLRVGARELERHAASHGAAWEPKGWFGGKLGVPIERQGRVVGAVNAELNKERVLDAVFSQARTDQGEVPFAIDESGQLFTPKTAHKATLASLGVTRLTGDAGATRVDSHDKWLVVKRRDSSGVTFGIARPLGDSLEALRRTMMRNLALGLLAIGVAAIGIVPISRRMTRDLDTLTSTAGQIAQGHFAVRVPVRSHDEIGKLATAFNRMAEGVEAHQKLVVEQERLQRELDLCRRIQTEMLPHGTLRLALAEVKGVSIPAREVGGDFFNYFLLDDGKIALLVGDVSGKGVGAALLMANVQATLRARLPLEQNLSALVDAIDRDVDERTPGGVFVTLFVGILDPSVRRLRYVNAGHHPQFVLNRNGRLERMPSAGLPVGLFAGHGYKEHEVTLDPGDLLFFYTDGTVETENESGEMFGRERLEALLEASTEGDSDSVLTRVEDALRDFRGKAEPFDDATMMALRVSAIAPGQVEEQGPI